MMNRRAGNLLRKIDILDLLNHMGTVLSSRRSAEIALCEYGSDEWLEFANAKQQCYTDGFKHRQQSNNSLVFNNKPTRDELRGLFDIMMENGGSEPGFINGQTATKRAPWFAGVNPCAEILLGNKSFCNLVEIDVSKFYGDSAGLHKAATLAARANYRQTVVDFRDGILQESWHLNNEFLRLCGVGATGIAMRDDMTEYDWKDYRYSAVTAARGMAKELGLQHPKNVTTVKPSGTLSKIMDTTEGVHKPLGKYIFNWVNFSKNDPLVLKLQSAGYRTLPNPGDSTGVLVCFPVKNDNVKFTTKNVTRKDGTVETLHINEESAITQLERYKKIQVNYCDQNVSNTISYSPEEVDDIVDWFMDNWDIYVGVSFLFRADPTMSARDLGYEYLPQEVVTQSRYEEYMNELSEIDWTNTDSIDEVDDGGCAGGACPIK